MNLIAEDHDDREFLDLTRRVVVEAASRFHPENVYVIHIDNWFGDRWVAKKCVGITPEILEDLARPQ